MQERLHWRPMRKCFTITAVSLALLLSACSTPIELTYDITFLRAPRSDSMQTQLITAMQDVIKGKLDAADVKNASVATIPNGSGGFVSIKNIREDQADYAQALLTMDFSFDVRVRKLEPVGDDPNALENWEKTAFTTEDLEWINVVQDSESGQAGVELILTPSGREKLSKIFTDHTKQDIGVFVRNQLVSSLSAGGTDVNERIVISGIPSIDIAKIFANDVNVGLYISLTPSS